MPAGYGVDGTGTVENPGVPVRWRSGSSGIFTQPAIQPAGWSTKSVPMNSTSCVPIKVPRRLMQADESRRRCMLGRPRLRQDWRFSPAGRNPHPEAAKERHTPRPGWVSYTGGQLACCCIRPVSRIAEMRCRYGRQNPGAERQPRFASEQVAGNRSGLCGRRTIPCS